MASQLTVLVIDDEPQIRRVVRNALGEGGARVVEAETGAAGIDLAAAERRKLEDTDVAGALLRFAEEKRVTLILVGQPARKPRLFGRTSIVDRLTANRAGIDVRVVGVDPKPGTA